MVGKIETQMNQQDSLITSEYAKKRTEKSPNSKLNVITKAFKDSKLSKIIEVNKLKVLIMNRSYREFQRLVWVPYKRCDWKLWNESLSYFKNHIDELTRQNNTVTQTGSYLSNLHWNISMINNGIWQLENLTDTIHIQHNEAQYLTFHETMSQNEYNRLFSGKERLQQWQLGDCYLVSWINELARAQHFDTLMRTSIQRMKRNDWELWYQIKIPLWEPSWRKILLKDSEIPVAKIRWNVWYKVLELAYAKNKLRKNDRNGNRYYPITSSELKRISWWWTKEVLQSFLGKQNIWFNDFWYKDKKEPLSKLSWTQKNEIHNFLKNYNPSIWNKFVSLSSLSWSNDTESYIVWWKKIYRKHAYSLTWVKKNSKWEIVSIRVLNPWNAQWTWKNYQDFTLNEFYSAFSAMSCGKIKIQSFLDNKWMA